MIPEIQDDPPFNLTLSHSELSVAKVTSGAETIKVLVIDVAGIARLAIPLADEIARDLASKLTGGVVLPTNGPRT